VELEMFSATINEELSHCPRAETTSAKHVETKSDKRMVGISIESISSPIKLSSSRGSAGTASGAVTELACKVTVVGEGGAMVNMRIEKVKLAFLIRV
jgi:hypothetical protein